MGCAPSAELLAEAPFRPPQGGVRQIALIPIVEQFFPTPDCPLFKQLYEAYTDPSVRYYVRPNFEGANGDLSRIPDVVNSRAQLHHLLLELTAQGLFTTNADVRATYAKGDIYRIRPILCAVVFLYEGANYVPEGSVQLPTHGRGPSVFVKVIGVVGDTSTMLHKAGDPRIPRTPSDTLKMQTLITKSAGDHNMSRVVLLAAYIYYHQCVEVIGLPKVPSMAACFTCFKTNIPFLCFLREMRDRTVNVLESPKDSKFYIDDHCLHGAVTQEYVDLMMPAFSYYFVSFLNAKSEQRMKKQLAHQQRASGILRDTPSDSKSASTSVAPFSGNSTRSDGSHHNEAGAPADQTVTARITQAALTAAKADAATDGTHSAAPKVTYIVKGYLTRPATTLSAWSCAANEVYVACAAGTVTVVDRRSVDAADGPTHTPSLNQPAGVEEIEEERETPASTRAVVETFSVRRGDILAFYSPASADGAATGTDAVVVDAEKAETTDKPRFSDGYDTDSMESSHNDLLQLNTDDDSALPSPSMSSMSKSEEGKESAVLLRKGSWRVDDDIYIESVLLSLVRDECKLAREASVDDPRWVHDDERNCPVHDGSFYVWHFHRGQENFFYGTVPKFANTNRTQGRGGGASGIRALRNGGVRVNKNGVLMDAHAGGQGSGAKRMDNSGSNSKGSNGGSAGQQPHLSLPMVLPHYTSPADSTEMAMHHRLPPQQQQQQSQEQPPSYVASHASSTAGTGAHMSNPLQGSGPMYVFPNGSVAQATAAPTAAPAGGQYIYSVPYMMPAPSPQFAMAGHGLQGMPPGAYMTSQGPAQAHGGTWVSMPGPVMPGQPSYGMGEFLNSPSFSGSTTMPSSMTNPSTAVPYMMNAQGQLVPLTSVMTDKTPPTAMQAASNSPPAPQMPSYVVMNGQLCVLQPATAAAAPPLPPPPSAMQYRMAAQPQPQQPYMSNMVYIQR